MRSMRNIIFVVKTLTNVWLLWLLPYAILRSTDCVVHCAHSHIHVHSYLLVVA